MGINAAKGETSGAGAGVAGAAGAAAANCKYQTLFYDIIMPVVFSFVVPCGKK